MPRLAANLTMLFNEAPFLERFERAAKAGFKAVEFLFPYDYPVGQVKDALDRNRLQLVLHNLPAGNWAGGERGIACDPTRVQEFRDGVDQAIAYATTLGVPQVNCLAGIKPANVADADARRTLVENLKFAAPKLRVDGPQRPGAPPSGFCRESGGHVLWLHPVSRCLPDVDVGTGRSQESPRERRRSASGAICDSRSAARYARIAQGVYGQL
jgi:hypothetical protein